MKTFSTTGRSWVWADCPLPGCREIPQLLLGAGGLCFPTLHLRGVSMYLNKKAPVGSFKFLMSWKDLTTHLLFFIFFTVVNVYNPRLSKVSLSA